MKMDFYPKLAVDGMRKNRRLYIPYILTSIGMAAMYYIVIYIQYSDTVSLLRGADTLKTMISLGGWVIAVFACIFLFYTNSFLLRRRKKEFGLYSVLGMNKMNIGAVIFWETFITAVISGAVGLFFGIALSKLAEAGLAKIVQGECSFDFSVSLPAVAMTVMVFTAVFLLLFINSFCQVLFSNTVSLMKSESKGEKAPKANWLFGISGLLLIGAAYYAAITIQSPLSALSVFFIAVIAVIVGTYLLFISGSVLMCKILQGSKKFYYNPKHFVSVSSMAYRMKRNGAGLASVCILATMVLVMISSASCLYVGLEDSLNARYPKEFNTEFHMDSIGSLSDENISALKGEVLALAEEKGGAAENIFCWRCVSVTGFIDGNKAVFDADARNGSLMNSDKVCIFRFLPLSDFNEVTGESVTLGEGEAVVYSDRFNMESDTLIFSDAVSFKIVTPTGNFVIDGTAAMDVVPTVYIAVNELEQTAESLGLAAADSELVANYIWTCNFDTTFSAGMHSEVNDLLCERIPQNGMKEKYGFASCYIESREENRSDYYGTFGGILFIGIVLSIVFISAAILIIYYKQISEGYEDQARFEIMKKVGMTENEIRRSINSQLLTVFYLPLLVAGIHLSFAFPIISRLLRLFNLYNLKLFALTTIVSFIVFALLYAAVYKKTSNSYCKIVNGIKSE